MISDNAHERFYIENSPLSMDEALRMVWLRCAYNGMRYSSQDIEYASA